MTMRKILMLAGVLLLMQGTARAEDAAPAAAAAAISPAEMQERLKYAADFQDVRPIREVIDRDFQNVADTLAESEREEFLRFVQLRVDYEKIEALSIKSLAELYTVPELKAMIAYFGSPEGKSAEAKAATYAAKISPEITKVIDAALMEAQYGTAPAQ